MFFSQCTGKNSFGYFSMIISVCGSTGPLEAGVQGVPRHTQYLAFQLVKTMFIPENLELGTCVHTQYSVASIDPAPPSVNSVLRVLLILKWSPLYF